MEKAKYRKDLPADVRETSRESAPVPKIFFAQVVPMLTRVRLVGLVPTFARPWSQSFLLRILSSSSTLPGSISGSVSGSSPLLSEYDEKCATGGFTRDPFQVLALSSLNRLHYDIGSLKGRRSSPVIKVNNHHGVYMHGGVGSGKTFLMNLFFDTAPTVMKKRQHFTTFMLDVHARMKAKQDEREEALKGGWLRRVLPKIHDDIGGTADSSNERTLNFFGVKMVLSSGDGDYGAVDKDNVDPLPVIAREIVSESRLLCLDEFEVTDVADAYILARLFTALFEEGIVLVATSNRAPSQLYHDGLNREVFLPTIKAIEEGCEVVSLEKSEVDYRGRKTRSDAESRFMAGKEGRSRFEKSWSDLLSGTSPSPQILSEASRKVTVGATDGGRSCRFSFDELCEGSKMPLGAAEFSLIARNFDTIYLSDLPNFNTGGSTIDGLRRLVLFVDVMYDASVKVVMSSNHDIKELWDPNEEILDPHSLNKHGDLIGGANVVPVDRHTRFSLDRTVSRLFEMSSDEFIQMSDPLAKEEARQREKIKEERFGL